MSAHFFASLLPSGAGSSPRIATLPPSATHFSHVEDFVHIKRPQGIEGKTGGRGWQGGKRTETWEMAPPRAAGVVHQCAVREVEGSAC